jgi:hypothetical protein
MGWFGLLFGPDGWAPLLFRGALITILLSLVTVPFGLRGFEPCTYFLNWTLFVRRLPAAH